MKCISIVPYLSDGKRYCMERIKEVNTENMDKKANETDLRLELINGSTIELKQQKMQWH